MINVIKFEVLFKAKITINSELRSELSCQNSLKILASCCREKWKDIRLLSDYYNLIIFFKAPFAYIKIYLPQDLIHLTQLNNLKIRVHTQLKQQQESHALCSLCYFFIIFVELLESEMPTWGWFNPRNDRVAPYCLPYQHLVFVHSNFNIPPSIQTEDYYLNSHSQEHIY